MPQKQSPSTKKSEPEQVDAYGRAMNSHFPVDPQTMNFLIPYIAGLSANPERIKDLQALADKHLPADARQEVVSAIASIHANIRTKSEVLPQLNKWIAEREGGGGKSGF